MLGYRKAFGLKSVSKLLSLRVNGGFLGNLSHIVCENEWADKLGNWFLEHADTPVFVEGSCFEYKAHEHRDGQHSHKTIDAASNHSAPVSGFEGEARHPAN